MDMRSNRLSIFSVIAGVLLMGSVSAASASNLIGDPSFESGGAGWTFTASSGSGCGAEPDVGITGDAHSGSFSAYKNCFRNGTGSFSQTISTSPGQAYFIEFWIAANGFQSGTVNVSFDGNTGYTDSSPGFQPYVQHSFIVTAGGATASFIVSGALAGGTYFVDDVSVTAVPEPGTVGLLVLGGLVVFASARRNSDVRS